MYVCVHRVCIVAISYFGTCDTCTVVFLFLSQMVQWRSGFQWPTRRLLKTSPLRYPLCDHACCLRLTDRSPRAILVLSPIYKPISLRYPFIVSDLVVYLLCYPFIVSDLQLDLLCYLFIVSDLQFYFLCYLF